MAHHVQLIDSVLKIALSENKYLYNGKELQDELLGSVNLDWYDYGVKFYDPALGKFPTIDPKSELFKFQSPYAYAANNPIKYIDKNGENPSIGIIICKTKRKTVVEYALKNTGSPMGVANYSISKTLPNSLKGLLPSSKEIIERLSLLAEI